MQYNQTIKNIINKKAENTTLRFFVYPSLENTHNTSCSYPCPWLHPPTDNTSDRRTIGKKRCGLHPTHGRADTAHSLCRCAVNQGWQTFRQRGHGRQAQAVRAARLLRKSHAKQIRASERHQGKHRNP